MKKKAKVSHHEIVDELKKMRKERHIIKPGKWSSIETPLCLRAKLKKYNSFCGSFPSFLGKYITHDDGYEGDGYRALVSIVVDNMPLLIARHGINEVLAACEKSLNSYKNGNGKKVLGNVVIMQLIDDRKEKNYEYLTCMIKTDRKFIPKFMGMKEGTLMVFT
jgi:hypothetical protein